MSYYFELIPKELKTIILLYAYPKNSYEIEESKLFDDILEDLAFWSQLFKQEDFGRHELEGLINFDKKEMIKHNKLSKNIKMKRFISEYINCQSVQFSRFEIINKFKDNKWSIEFLSYPINWDVFLFNLKDDDNLIKFMEDLMDSKNMSPYIISIMTSQDIDLYISIKYNQRVFIKYSNIYDEYNLQFINFNTFIKELLWEVLYNRIKVDIKIE